MTFEEAKQRLEEFAAANSTKFATLPDGVMWSARLSFELSGLFLGGEIEFGALYDNQGLVGYYATVGGIIEVGTPGGDFTISEGLVFGSLDDFKGISFEAESSSLAPSFSFGRPLSISGEIDTARLAVDVMSTDWNDAESLEVLASRAPAGFSVHYGGGSDIGIGAEFGYTFVIPARRGADLSFAEIDLSTVSENFDVLSTLIGATRIANATVVKGPNEVWQVFDSNGGQAYNTLSEVYAGVYGLVPNTLKGTAFENFLPSTLLSASGGLDADWDWSTVDFNTVSLAASVNDSGYSFNYVSVPGITVTSTAGDWKGTFAQTSDGIPIFQIASQSYNITQTAIVNADGGAIDAASNDNSGAFQMRVAQSGRV